MAEEGVRVFANVALGFEIAGSGVFFALYAGRLAGDGVKNRLRVWSAFVVYAAVYALKATILTFPGWVAIIVIGGVIAGIWAACGAEKPERVIFLVMTYYCVHLGTTLIVQSFDTLLFDRMALKVVTEEQAYVVIRVINAVSVASRVLACGAGLLALGKIIRKRLTGDISRRELVWLSFTPLVGAFFVNIVFRMLGVIKDDTYFELYEIYPSFRVIVPVTVLLLLAGVAASIYMCGSMRAYEEERRLGFAREQQIREIERRMAEESRADEATRRLRHDIRSHLMNLQGLLARGEYEEAKVYIGTAGEMLGGVSLALNTGNPVTDIIVNDAKTRAESLGIRFGADLRYDRQEGAAGIELFDLGIVVSNLLTNALEACASCAGEKYVTVTSRMHGNFYLIEVINSFEGKIKWGASGRMPVSTKPTDGDIHGIGLGNVAKVADKYNGSMKLDAGDGEFRVVVMLQKMK